MIKHSNIHEISQRFSHESQWENPLETGNRWSLFCFGSLSEIQVFIGYLWHIHTYSNIIIYIYIHAVYSLCIYIYIYLYLYIYIYIICMEYVLHTYGIKFLKQTHVDPLCDRHNGAVSLRRPGRLLPLDRITQSYTIQRIYIYYIHM